MFNFNEIELEQFVVHHIGNKHEEEGLQLSKKNVELEPSIQALLFTYFLSPFKSTAFYNFTHESDINLNPVFNYAKQIFNDASKFFELSTHIAQLLYDTSNHPKIKAGEFYMTLFRNCVVEDEIVDAIGIFKSENKDTFLKVYQKGSEFAIEHEDGININKLDKGCLIFNTEMEAGYKISIVDNLNKGKLANFWQEDFLGLKEREDDFYNTRAYMQLCKGFVEEVYNEENNVEKPDQADLLNKSANYFKEKEKFDEHEFENEVMGDNEEIKNAFKEYKDHYQEDKNVALNEKEFEISKEAVKKGRAQFKSVLKLDKNFHVYIHGNRERIIKGFDPSSEMHYYQLFFENED